MTDPKQPNSGQRFRKLQKGQVSPAGEVGFQLLRSVCSSTLIVGLTGVAMLSPIIILFGWLNEGLLGLYLVAIPPGATLIGSLVLVTFILAPATYLLARKNKERAWHYVLLGVAGGLAMPPMFLWFSNWDVLAYWDFGATAVLSAFGGLAGCIAGSSWGRWRADLRQRRAGLKSPIPATAPASTRD